MERSRELYEAGLQVGLVIRRVRARVDEIVDNVREYAKGIEDAAQQHEVDEEETQ